LSQARGWRPGRKKKKEEERRKEKEESRQEKEGPRRKEKEDPRRKKKKEEERKKRERKREKEEGRAEGRVEEEGKKKAGWKPARDPPPGRQGNGSPRPHVPRGNPSRRKGEQRGGRPASGAK